MTLSPQRQLNGSKAIPFPFLVLSTWGRLPTRRVNPGFYGLVHFRAIWLQKLGLLW